MSLDLKVCLRGVCVCVFFFVVHLCLYSICFLTIVKKDSFLVIVLRRQKINVSLILIVFYDMCVFSQMVFC